MTDNDRLIQHIIDIKTDIAKINAKQDTLIKAQVEQIKTMEKQDVRLSNLEGLKNKVYGAAAVAAGSVGLTSSWLFNIFKGH